MQALLRAGAAAGAAATDGTTPLHLAAAAGDEAGLRLLLAAGAAAEAEDEGGARPLHLAAAAVRRGAARLLMEEGGARPEARDGCGRSPLDLAALLRPSSIEIVTEIVTPLLTQASAVAAAPAETPAEAPAAADANAQAAEQGVCGPLAASSASPGRDASPPPPPLPTSTPLAGYRERALRAEPRYAPQLLHAEPWLVQLDNLLSRAEVHALLDTITLTPTLTP
eukprot:scaffold97102_cov45-Phaeocystis_antarctica.AAC.1